MLNEFAPFLKINGCFIVNNISNPKKTIFIFNYPIPHGASRDLLQIPGVGEGDIRASLLKGELQHKLRNTEITVLCSDIDLLQFNPQHKAFLQAGGITTGLQVGSGEFDIVHYEDVQLVGAVDGSNTVFAVPEGVFYYDSTHKILVYKNGIKQFFLDDFYIAESGGPGTGYDTVIMTDPPDALPAPTDVITADYYIQNV